MRTLQQMMQNQRALTHPMPLYEDMECLDDEFDDYYEANKIPSMCSQCGKVTPDEDAYCDDCGGRIV